MERKDEKKKVLTREPLTFPQTIPLKTDSDLSVVGQPVSRTDARLKAAGKLAFGADYPQENFLHGKILRSPHPHARIKAVRIDKAKEFPGVVAVLLAKDVPGRNGFGVVVPDQPVICGDKVVVGSDDGRLYVVSLDKGKELWSYEVGQPIESSPAVARAKVVIGAGDGKVYCFGAK